MKISSDREQVKIVEAARMLGCIPETVRRMVRAGYLSSHTLPGAGLSAPRYIPMRQIRDIVHGRRSFRGIEDAAKAGAGISWKTADWFDRDRILQKKAGALAKIYGPEPILALLKRLGVASIGECNPDQQRVLNGHLIRLAGYNRQSRTTQWRRKKEKEKAA